VRVAGNRGCGTRVRVTSRAGCGGCGRISGCLANGHPQVEVPTSPAAPSGRRPAGTAGVGVRVHPSPRRRERGHHHHCCCCWSTAAGSGGDQPPAMHARCARRARVAHRPACAAPSLHTRRRAKRRRKTRTTTGDRTREEQEKTTQARDVRAEVRRLEPPAMFARRARRARVALRSPRAAPSLHKRRRAKRRRETRTTTSDRTREEQEERPPQRATSVLKCGG
jgi:hypothetical protein